VPAAIIGALATGVAYDDAWITYRYAYNLASGNGLVYNAGERFLGTTAPFYAVLLAPGGWFSPAAIPAASGGLCMVSLVAIGLGLYAYGRARGDSLGGLLAGLFFVVSPIVMESFGGEMVPQTALVVWAFVAEVRQKWMVAVALAIVATLIRPDGIVALGMIGVHQIWTRRLWPWREFAIAGVGLGVWYGALWLYFGSPVPQTLAAKHAQRVSGLWRPLGFDMVDWFRSLTIYPSLFFPSRPTDGFTTFLVLSALGLLPLLWLRHWWLLATWPVCYMVAYRQLHVPSTTGTPCHRSWRSRSRPPRRVRRQVPHSWPSRTESGDGGSRARCQASVPGPFNSSC
jgi:hypothetical protein